MVLSCGEHHQDRKQRAEVLLLFKDLVFCVTHRAPLETHGNVTWPGGKIDFRDLSPSDVAWTVVPNDKYSRAAWNAGVRELREETGLDLTSFAERHAVNPSHVTVCRYNCCKTMFLCIRFHSVNIWMKLLEAVEDGWTEREDKRILGWSVHSLFDLRVLESNTTGSLLRKDLRPSIDVDNLCRRRPRRYQDMTETTSFGKLLPFWRSCETKMACKLWTECEPNTKR